VAFFEARGHTQVPSASLVPAGDATLLFTNSGMVQFKELFSGAETRSYRRAVDYQRCLRVAGKHNDFEEVGRTPRHHTLFEMLGSWSFGDYFKRDAILWAWEFLTVEAGIPADRLAVTVYSDDEESANIWLKEVGVPADRLARWGDVDKGNDANFWRMAETGPCGPCSEIHFDRGADLSCGADCLPDHSEHCPRWLEVWNLVFMQYEQHPDGRRTELPFKSVDTGMGLERLASVSQQVLSNYDTDLFLPIHAAMRKITKHSMAEFDAQRFSYQVIADHSRAVTFLLADGVRPGNEGRGYVLRRIIRRAVRHARLLGITKPFLGAIAREVVAIMGPSYPYLRDGETAILEGIEREEAQFARTLDAGSSLLGDALAELGAGESVVGRRADDLPATSPTLGGEIAFKLHDTYGFPIDLTVELAAERGVAVDRAGFESALAEQRERSRGGKKAALAEIAVSTALYEEILRRVGETEFVGYEHLESESAILGLLRDGVEVPALAAGEEGQLIVGRTPFYAERGGQVGDAGQVFDANGKLLAEVSDTQRPVGALTVHTIRAAAPLKMRNHTATHVLHRAIRIVAGADAKQRGSLVHPDYLRFDYPLERSLTRDERDQTEAEVRRAIREDMAVVVAHMSMGEAVKAGADAFFDEKYGETVRTVRMEEYSHELCGGTHCRATGQIGSFVITSERSIGSGLRRIEALTGAAADEYLRQQSRTLEASAEAAGAQDAHTVPQRIAALQAELKEAKRRAKAGGSARIDLAALAAQATARGAISILVTALDVEDDEALKEAAKQLRKKMGAGVLALVRPAESPEIFVSVEGSAEHDAGALAAAAATALGGRGGGRAAMGQGRGAVGSSAEEAATALAATLGVEVARS
jgi:alanyl-tRNA synthetase